MVLVEKPKFVYTGAKVQYREQWCNQNKGYVAETNSAGTIHWIIKTGGERIDCYYGDPNRLIEHVRRRVAVHTTGSRANSSGIARVYIKDVNSGEEVMVLVVEKMVHRYYEPVERFNHKERI